MARAYHNLAGLCRDIRAAAGAASEGDEAAERLLHDLDDVLGLLDAIVDGDLPGGQEGDGAAFDDDTEDQDEPVVDVPRETRGMASLGTAGARTAQHSTRARAADERRPSRGRLREQVGTRSCEARAVPTAGPRDGGKR